MIHSVKGRLKQKTPSGIVVDVGGVSLHIIVSVPTYDHLPDAGAEVGVRTYLNVREDALELYGFYSQAELDLFKMLIGITKIGPKLAIGILSGASPDEFRRRIVAGDVAALTALPGIGPKTAKRIIVELKEKFVAVEGVDQILEGDDTLADEFADALAALTALGHSRAEGFRVLSELRRRGDLHGGLEEIVKSALARL